MSTILTIAAICFLFGAIIGSFLSVCIYRIPHGKYEPVREGPPELPHPVSIADPPRSFCPRCQHQLEWYHNIPLISWLALGGKCSFCKERIPFRYFFVELITALLAVACYLRFGLNISALVAFGFVATMIVIAFVDIDYMIIPDVISYPGTIIGFALGAVNQFFSSPGAPLLDPPFSPSLVDSFLGVLCGAGVLYAVWWLYLKIRKKDGLGFGDIKLLAMIGATFGWECAWFTIFLGSILGSVIGIASAVISRRGFSQYLPFGPYLVLGVFGFLFDAVGIYDYFAHGRPLTSWWIAYQYIVQP